MCLATMHRAYFVMRSSFLERYSTLNELVARLNDSFEDTAAVRLTEIEQTLSDNLYATLRDDDSRFSADYRFVIDLIFFDWLIG